MIFNKVINKDKDKFDFKLGMFIFIFLILFISLISLIGKDKNKKYEKKNMIYVQIINYTLPSIKVSNFDAEDMAENAYSLKNLCFGIVGIDINHPENIVSREMSFLGGKLPQDKVKTSGDEFSLNDSDVVKNTDNNVKDQRQKTSEANVYDPKFKKTLDKSKPEVLIYHSHTTEAYKPATPDTLDDTKNVCAVGDELARELGQNYGIYAINDKTVHNVVAYNKSYTRSGETLDKYLKQYGDFKMIIDMHRDSGVDKKAVTATINGENVAKFMFVMARKNPHYDKNIAMVNGLVSICNKDFPGIFNGIYYYDYGTNYFNQNKSNNAFLLEVGSDINTIDEAKATSKYLARIIAEYLNAKK
ncbi:MULTISPECIES: stage II sporulation protein P [Clostridium]|uniref:stage II sporulation protein P n=1 Tax=Clostridium TaxID=1485 RepID=UPI0008258312|nr:MULTISPECIES: stage II sporulation protein P [Clostridium]